MVITWVSLMGIGRPRPGQRGYQQGGLHVGKTIGRMAEVVPAGGLAALDAVAKLYDVKVTLHDAFLTPQQFYQQHIIGLHYFTQQRATMREEAIFGRLLRNGAAATQGGGFLVMIIRIIETVEHEAPAMVKKPPIFAYIGHAYQVGRNIFYGYQKSAEPDPPLGISQPLKTAMDHQRSNGRVEKLAKNHLHQGPRPQTQNNPHQHQPKTIQMGNPPQTTKQESHAK